MEIIKYKEHNTEAIVSLFYDTIHSVNSKHYSKIQLDAWAPIEEKEYKLNTWNKILIENITYVAKVDNQVIGFCDLTHKGHLFRLFVHKDYQGKGVARALVDRIETEARRLNILEIDTEASITAKGFFEHKGYTIVCSQTIERKGIKLTNFKMTKKL